MNKGYMGDKQHITVMVGDTNFPLNVEKEEEQAYRDASKLVNNTLNKYRGYFGKDDPTRVMAMVALEIAVEKVKLGNKNDTTPFVEKLEQLTEELEEYFRK